MLNTLLYGGNLRCVVVISTEMTREAQRRQQLDPLATIALGRALACAAVLASNVKTTHGVLHCSLEGDGPLRKVVAECDGSGHCRGYVSVPQLATVLEGDDPVPQCVGEALGANGQITVTHIEDRGKLPYTGVAPLASGEIAADVASYLANSVQTPSAVASGVKLNSEAEVLGAGAILVQKMGGSHVTEAQLAEIEAKLHTDFRLSDRIADGESVDDIFRWLTGIDPTTIFLTKRPIKFFCDCGRERMKVYLTHLGEAELRSIQEEVGKIEVRCQYCGDTHLFTLDELLRKPGDKLH